MYIRYFTSLLLYLTASHISDKMVEYGGNKDRETKYLLMKIKDVNENKSKTSDFGHGASFMGRGGRRPK